MPLNTKSIILLICYLSSAELITSLTSFLTSTMSFSASSIFLPVRLQWSISRFILYSAHHHQTAETVKATVIPTIISISNNCSVPINHMQNNADNADSGSIAPKYIHTDMCFSISLLLCSMQIFTQNLK